MPKQPERPSVRAGLKYLNFFRAMLSDKILSVEGSVVLPHSSLMLGSKYANILHTVLITMSEYHSATVLNNVSQYANLALPNYLAYSDTFSIDLNSKSHTAMTKQVN